MRAKIKDSRILITGGAGFIGSHLADRLFQDGAKEILIIDNMFNGYEENIKLAQLHGAELIKDDIEDVSVLNYIFNKNNFDIVFNCATKALNYSFVNPKNSFITNPNGILNILEHQRIGNFGTLVHFSTSEVYGTAKYEPMDESHPFSPTTTYAAGKAAADYALMSYVNMFNVDSFIIRPFNNYGPRQNYKGYLAGVIPRTIMKILNNSSPEIQGDGRQTRDFIFVDDTVDAIVKVYPDMKSADAINISSDGQISINEVVRKICEILNYKGEIKYTPRRSADVLTHTSDNNKLKNMIKFNETPFDIGLTNTVKWYLNL